MDPMDSFAVFFAEASDLFFNVPLASRSEGASLAQKVMASCSFVILGGARSTFYISFLVLLRTQVPFGEYFYFF